MNQIACLTVLLLFLSSFHLPAATNEELSQRIDEIEKRQEEIYLNVTPLDHGLFGYALQVNSDQMITYLVTFLTGDIRYISDEVDKIEV